jgi:hypothetical protein
MTFSELTWNQDQWNEDTQSLTSWQAQYEADNGYLLIVNTQSETLPVTANETGQLYSCSIWSYDRSVGSSSPIFTEGDCTNNRISTLIDQTKAYAQPEPEVDPNETSDPDPASGQWD